MNTESHIIQIKLEEAIEVAWKNFLTGLPMHDTDARLFNICRLCFSAGFLDGVKMKNLSDQLGRKAT